MTNNQTIQIEGLPAFDDNYIWLMHSTSGQAVVIDPGDAIPVKKAIDERGLTLEAIMLTHHHFDHIGGVEALQQLYPEPIRIVGPASKQIPMVTEVAHEGDTVTTLGINWHVISVPGHTLDHIAYFGSSPALGEAPVLFCGDTLFAAGCGRMFEGHAAMMWQSLDKLRQLPSNTQCYCAHEYTQSNIQFALSVEPENHALNERAKYVNTMRSQSLPTVPMTLSEELNTNPFLRCDTQSVRNAAVKYLTSELATNEQAPDSPETVFGAIRQWKDHF